MDTIIINGICFILFPALVLWKAEYNRNWNETVLTKDDSAALRGIAAVFVVFAHYLNYLSSQGMTGLGPAKLYEWCGGLGVCVFFFVSGYGLEITYQKKSVDFIYIKNRFFSIIPTFLTLRMLFALLLAVWKQGWVYFCLYLLNLKDPMWFISEIVIIYIFYFVAMNLSRRYCILLMTLFLTVMSSIFYFLEFDARWYNANLVFIVGMLIAKYKTKLLTFLKQAYWLKIAVCFGLFAITAIAFTIFRGGVWANCLKLLAGAMFSIALFAIFMKLRMHSGFLLFLGRNSLQLYIIHLGVRELFGYWEQKLSLLLIFIVGLALSVFGTVGYVKLEYYIRKTVSHRRN